MRARLLLAFLAIAAFAVMAAAAGLYAFRQVGERLEVIDTRIPPALSALELSRSAERVIAATPALLAATNRVRRDNIQAELAAEIARLEAILDNVTGDSAKHQPTSTIETIVSSLTTNLAILEQLVERRLEASERIASMRRDVFRTHAEMQRLLAPWLEVVEREMSGLAENREVVPSGPGEQQGLTALIDLQRLLRTTQARISTVADMLVEASTTEQPERLPVLAFQLARALRDLDSSATALDPKLRPLFMERLTELRELAEGPDAISALRKRELDLLRQGEELLTANGELSRRLAGAVDKLGSDAKQDVGGAVRDALSVQRLSGRALAVVVALSLVTSVLIVWLYVGRNIVRRLTVLSDGMLSIAGGRVDAPVPSEAADEIGAMGRAVEVFRRNTLERNRLLAEKAHAAEMLEREVEERTAELARSVEELRALGEVSRAVSSTVELETVLTTIVAKASQLSDTEAGALYVYDDVADTFRLRATHGMDEGVIDEIRRHQLRLGETVVGEAVERGTPIQIPDIRDNPSSTVLDVVVDAGYRALLIVPLLGPEGIIGALVVRRKQPGPFPQSIIELLQTFAAQSVLAIRNASLFAQVEEKSRQLEIANRYKSHFLASASHDLRQPLHALNLFVAQLRNEANPGTRRRLVDRINTAVNSMNELFEALLDMTKLDAGVLEPSLGDFPVGSLLSRIETTFGEAARRKGLRLIVAPSNAWIRSDFILLERILMNLVSNAVRYTTSGGVVVGCRRRDGRLRIDVCDSGTGIPEEQQRNIFGESVQLAGSRPDQLGGLGLGLSIVERLGQLLDHPIEVSSRIGRGSRFSVSVPLVAPRGAAAEMPDSLLAIADPARGKVVVVIDDDDLVLDGMAGILASWGCVAITADSGEAALAKLHAQRLEPDLIISDYRLATDGTGIDVIGRLRRAFDAAIPAFLISGDTGPDLARDVQEHGYRLLHKPIAPMRLRAMVNRFLAAPEIGNESDLQTRP